MSSFRLLEIMIMICSEHIKFSPRELKGVAVRVVMVISSEKFFGFEELI